MGLIGGDFDHCEAAREHGVDSIDDERYVWPKRWPLLDTEYPYRNPAIGQILLVTEVLIGRDE